MELPNRDQFDGEAASALSALGERQRREAVDIMGTPPDFSKITPYHWAKWQKETEEELLSILLLLFVSSAEFHGSTPDAAEAAGQQWASGQSRQIASQLMETTYDKLSGIQSTTSRAEANELMDAIFGRDRMGRIATDVVTTAQTAGGEWSIHDLVGISDDDIWKTNPGLSDSGPCKICEPLNGQPRYVWALQFPEGPPGPHPGCVCEIVYANLSPDVARN